MVQRHGCIVRVFFSRFSLKQLVPLRQTSAAYDRHFPVCSSSVATSIEYKLSSFLHLWIFRHTWVWLAQSRWSKHSLCTRPSDCWKWLNNCRFWPKPGGKAVVRLSVRGVPPVNKVCSFLGLLLCSWPGMQKISHYYELTNNTIKFWISYRSSSVQGLFSL